MYLFLRHSVYFTKLCVPVISVTLQYPRCTIMSFQNGKDICRLIMSYMEQDPSSEANMPSGSKEVP